MCFVSHPLPLLLCMPLLFCILCPQSLPFMVIECGVWFWSDVGTGDGANFSPGSAAEQSMPKFQLCFFFLIFPVFFRIFLVPYHKLPSFHSEFRCSIPCRGDGQTMERKRGLHSAHHLCRSPFPAAWGLSLPSRPLGKRSIQESPMVAIP